MFSGIVEEMATVVAIKHDKENINFTLRCSFVDELGIDQSVAHNGVCLTVVEIKDGTYTVTAMKETLDRSNLGLLKVGDLLSASLHYNFGGGRETDAPGCPLPQEDEGGRRLSAGYLLLLYLGDSAGTVALRPRMSFGKDV